MHPDIFKSIFILNSMVEYIKGSLDRIQSTGLVYSMVPRGNVTNNNSWIREFGRHKDSERVFYAGTQFFFNPFTALHNLRNPFEEKNDTVLTPDEQLTEFDHLLSWFKKASLFLSVLMPPKSKKHAKQFPGDVLYLESTESPQQAWKDQQAQVVAHATRWYLDNRCRFGNDFGSGENMSVRDAHNLQAWAKESCVDQIIKAYQRGKDEYNEYFQSELFYHLRESGQIHVGLQLLRALAQSQSPDYIEKLEAGLELIPLVVKQEFGKAATLKEIIESN